MMAVELGVESIYVHAKIMVIDGTSIRGGSANINNRSMGLDSECDVVVESEAVASKAAGLRNRLLAEQLGVWQQAAAAAFAEHGLIGMVEKLRGDGRSLHPYEVPELRTGARWLADGELLDPESPAECLNRDPNAACSGAGALGCDPAICSSACPRLRVLGRCNKARLMNVLLR